MPITYTKEHADITDVSKSLVDNLYNLVDSKEYTPDVLSAIDTLSNALQRVGSLVGRGF